MNRRSMYNAFQQALVFPLLFVGCYAGEGTAGEEPCQKDVDCKGDRVCLAGTCVDPSTDGTDGATPTGGEPTTGVIDPSSSTGADPGGGGEVLPPKPEDEEEMGEDADIMPVACQDGAPLYASAQSGDFCPIPVLVLVDHGGGEAALTEEEVEQEIAFVNEYFAASFLSFAVIEVRAFTSDAEVEDARSTQHVTLAYYHDLDGICGSAFRGVTTTRPRAIADRGCTFVIGGGNTTVHELGHVLGLYHTHGTKGKKGDAPVEELDAACYDTPPNVGDYLCDTPADPSTGYCTAKKKNGECFVTCPAYPNHTPDPGLVMSYYSDACQSPATAFSPEQLNTMRCIIDTSFAQLGICQNCTPNAYEQCSSGDLYHFDSCNQIGPLAESCDDNNPCTQDSCGGAACQHSPVPDGTSCGNDMMCQGGSCLGEQGCRGGPCCDAGELRPASYVCVQGIDEEYGCPWGTDPGEDVGVRTRDRHCSGSGTQCDGAYGAWSSWDVADACTSDEVCAPGDATCNLAPCQASSYWDPIIPTDTDNSGLQYNQTINVPLTFEVAESGAGLKFRVCRSSGTFMNDIKVGLHDGADGSAGALVAKLSAAGAMCSSWAEMSNDTNYAFGEQFGGIWNVVSPYSSAGDWDDYGGCFVDGTPTGTCWSGINITMTRTCKQ